MPNKVRDEYVTEFLRSLISAGLYRKAERETQESSGKRVCGRKWESMVPKKTRIEKF